MRVVFAVNTTPHAPPAQMALLASARYRGFIPAGQLQQDGHRAEVTALMELFRPDFDTRLDLLVLHQPKHDILLLANVIKVLFDRLDAIRSQGGRIVVDVSDFKLSSEFLDAMAKAFGPDKAQTYRSILEGVFARCDAVTVPTEALAAQLRETLGSAKPVFVIDDVVEVAPQPATFAPGQELQLLWFGFLTAHIAALRQLIHDDLPKIRRQRPATLKLVCEKLPSGESRQVFGAAEPASFGVAYEQWSVPVLEASLAACDLVVLPFDADSASSKGKSNNRALQALAAGRYVVAHPLESYQTLGDFIGLDASIANAVETAVSHPANTLARLQAGQDFVQARYSPAANAARWLAVLGDLKKMNPPITILALSASVSPTLAIHLLRPLQGLPGINIQMLTQEALAQITKGAPPGIDGLSLAAMILNQVRPALVFSSRYNGAMAEEFLAASRKQGVPFVFHLDDNLMEVSADQGAEKVAYYNDPRRLQALRAQMEQASVAYFSTDALRDRMLDLGIRVARPHVGSICAAVDLLPLPPVPTSLTFGYAASGGHNEDLKLALPGIVAALEQHPQARFELIGSLEHIPAELARFGERVRHERRFIAYDDYLRDLQRRNWVLGLTPLCDNPFTRMKTYTKWVEYTAAGLPVIASDHPIYRDCCADGAALLVKDADWASALPNLLDDAAARAVLLAKARERVGREYSVARLRSQLLEVFKLAGLTI